MPSLAALPLTAHIQLAADIFSSPPVSAPKQLRGQPGAHTIPLPLSAVFDVLGTKQEPAQAVAGSSGQAVAGSSSSCQVCIVLKSSSHADVARCGDVVLLPADHACQVLLPPADHACQVLLLPACYSLLTMHARFTAPPLCGTCV